jgi:hypothetical protein
MTEVWIRSIFEQQKCPNWTWSPRVLLWPWFFNFRILRTLMNGYNKVLEHVRWFLSLQSSWMGWHVLPQGRGQLASYKFPAWRPWEHVAMYCSWICQEWFGWWQYTQLQSQLSKQISALRVTLFQNLPVLSTNLKTSANEVTPPPPYVLM